MSGMLKRHIITHTMTQILVSPLSPSLCHSNSRPNSRLSLPLKPIRIRIRIGVGVGGYSHETEEYLEAAQQLRFKKKGELELEVTELEDLPENWRRSKLAWLCKEIPSHKPPTISRLLTSNKKWIRQPDATYILLHCLRIRHNQPAFTVYKWMIEHSWFRFDFALATKLADSVGRDRKFAKCRDIFDHILNQGRVPSQSTFHILIVAYLSAQGEDCLDQACDIYTQMIHLGAYRPLLSLHNALFRAILNKPPISATKYLKQAEFIFHNLVTSGFEVHKDIYGGLLWLHSYQDSIDKERMLSLRKEMHRHGINDTKDTLLSILRASSKEGDLAEADMTWVKLLNCEGNLPSQAYVYKMQVHAKVEEFGKSLDIFREMQEQSERVGIVAYQKIIEIMCNAREVELAELLMKELIKSGLKPLIPSFLHLLYMFYKLSLHDKVESTFFECLQRCRPNQSVYGIYLESLVQTNNIVRAESIFSQIVANDDVGVSSRSCNTLLNGYLFCNNDHIKAEKLYRFMCEQSYEVEPSLFEKLESVIRYSKKVVQKSVVLKLTSAQREVLVGLLLGGLQVDYAEDKKKHFVSFEFNDSCVHSVLKRHIYNKYLEWLQRSNPSTNDGDNIPSKFLTVPHAFFGFYADQFWSNGKRTVPKLIHRWLSPRALAYWFMYSGYKTPTGKILLKLNGCKGDVERVFKALKSKSLEFRVKQKGKVFWLGFMESDSVSFWRLIEPYILDDLQGILEADNQFLENGVAETSSIQYNGEPNSDYVLEPNSSAFSDSDGS